VTVISALEHPIVLAPLSGGPSTPELAAAVNAAGGFGFLAAGYLSADDLRQRIAKLRELSEQPFGVNLFVPGEPTAPGIVDPYVELISQDATARGYSLGTPRYDDDGWEAKLDLLCDDPVAVVSFTFGCPDAAAIERVQQAGSEAWVTVTTPDEAAQAKAAGADGLVLQGAEAGGHRGSFANTRDLPTYGVLALLQLTADLGLPRMAAGGIAHGSAVAAVLAAGAEAAALGTAFLRCPEAGTNRAHRQVLATSTAPTRLTQAFTGRLARGIPNRFMDTYDPHAVTAYPEIHYVTAPMRAAAREAEDPSVLNLWAGQAYPLAEAIPATEVVARLVEQAASAAATAVANTALSVMVEAE
jgi:nitronate monooxygenase